MSTLSHVILLSEVIAKGQHLPVERDNAGLYTISTFTFKIH